MKKILLFTGAMALILGGVGFSYAPSARAVTSDVELFNPITILGLSVLGGNVGAAESEFVLIDRDNSEFSTTYNLPSVEGRDGQLYIIKLLDNGTYVEVHAATGESIDYSYSYVTMTTAFSSMIFLADEDNETWWLLSYGMI